MSAERKEPEARQREVWYTYGSNHEEHELPEHARLRIYFGHRPNAWVEIAYDDKTGGIDLRGSDRMTVVPTSSNALTVDLHELFERRTDTHKRDLAEAVYDRLTAHGADYNAMCELATDIGIGLRDESTWRAGHPWVKTVLAALKKRFTAKAK